AFSPTRERSELLGPSASEPSARTPVRSSTRPQGSTSTRAAASLPVERLQRAWDVEPGYSKTALAGGGVQARSAAEPPSLPRPNSRPNAVRRSAPRGSPRAGPRRLGLRGALAPCNGAAHGAARSGARGRRARHPVSTVFASRGLLERTAGGLRSAVPGRVVGRVGLAGSGEGTKPGAGKESVGGWGEAATGERTTVGVRGPRGAVARVVGPCRHGRAQAFVARPTECDVPVLARLLRHGSDAGLGGEVVIVDEAPAIVAELGQDLSRVD